MTFHLKGALVKDPEGNQYEIWKMRDVLKSDLSNSRNKKRHLKRSLK